jgi:hypothetical protein
MLHSWLSRTAQGWSSPALGGRKRHPGWIAFTPVNDVIAATMAIGLNRLLDRLLSFH